MKVSVLQDPDGPHSSSLLLCTCTDSSLCTPAQVRYHVLCAPNPVPTCTLLPTLLSWEPPLLTSPHQPQPPTPTPPPSSSSSSSSLLTPKFSPSPSPGLPKLQLPGDLVHLKGRKKEKGRKNRKKEGNRRMKRRKGQWCLELSQCITMNMDSIKLRSAC